MKKIENNIKDEVSRDEFLDMYYNGSTVYKVSFYDRTEQYKGNRSYRYFKTEEGAREFVRMMKVYNDRVVERMVEIYGKYGVTKENYKCNRVWNRILNKIDFEKVGDFERRLFHYEDDSVGYCHIDIFEKSEENDVMGRVYSLRNDIKYT